MVSRSSRCPDVKVRYTNEHDYLEFQRLAFAREVRWSSQAKSLAQHLDYSKPVGVILRSALLHTCFSKSDWEGCNLHEVDMGTVVESWRGDRAPKDPESLGVAL